MKNTKFILPVLLFCVIFSFSCSSVPKEIPENLTSQELIQKGQECYENANYEGALAYYETAVARFSDWPSTYIEAKYEIAHVYMKQKKYEKAEAIFNEILQMFKSAAPGSYPAAYKKLSEIGLQKISETRTK